MQIGILVNTKSVSTNDFQSLRTFSMFSPSSVKKTLQTYTQVTKQSNEFDEMMRNERNNISFEHQVSAPVVACMSGDSKKKFFG